MVYAEKVGDEEVKGGSVFWGGRGREERKEVGDDAVVYGVEVLDVERVKGKGEVLGKGGGKDGEPGVVSHKG